MPYFATAIGEEPTFVIVSLDFANLYALTSDGVPAALVQLGGCSEAFSTNSEQFDCKIDKKKWESDLKQLMVAVSDVISKLILRYMKLKSAKRGGDEVKEFYKSFLGFVKRDVSEQTLNEFGKLIAPLANF